MVKRTKQDYAERYPSFDADGSTQVERCISGVMARYNGTGPAALARFFEAVHQELAPLARELERQNTELRKQLAEPRLKIANDDTQRN